MVKNQNIQKMPWNWKFRENCEMLQFFFVIYPKMWGKNWKSKKIEKNVQENGEKVKEKWANKTRQKLAMNGGKLENVAIIDNN